MIWRNGVLAAVAALSLGVSALPARAETLADALVLAYRHSGLLEQNRAVLRAADEDVAQAISQLRPIIEYSVQAQRSYVFPNNTPGRTNPATGRSIVGISDDYEDTASIGISASLLLYDGGQTRLGIDVARETVLATRQSLIQVEQQVLFDAVSAYLAVREAQAFVNLRRSNVDLLTAELDASQERFDVGEVTRTDVALAESQLAAARSLLSSALGDREIAQAQYVRAVGQEPGDLAPVDGQPATAPSLAAAQSVARQSHPTVLREMRGVTIAGLNVLRAEAARRPQVSGSVSAQVDQDYTENATIGLQMTGPIYQGGALSSAIRQALARRDESRANLHVTVDDVLESVAQAWAQRAVAVARIEAGQLEVRAARIAFNGLQEEVSLGARTTLDVLDAEQDLSDARANLISAQIAEIRSAYQILFAMGLLTVEHLGLGVTTYDPDAYYRAVKDAPSTTRISPQGRKLDKLLESIGR